MARSPFLPFRSHLIRLSLATFAVFVAFVTVTASVGLRAVNAWEEGVSDRAAQIVSRTIQQKAREVSHAADERSYMSEPAGVVSGRNAEETRKRLTEEQTHFLRINGYAFLLVANADREVVYTWNAPDRPVRSPELPPAFFDRVDAGEPLGGFWRTGPCLLLIGASRLHNADGSAGPGYFILGRPFDDELLSAIDPDAEIHLGLRTLVSNQTLPARSFAGDSAIIRLPLRDLLGEPVGMVEAAFARDAHHRLVRWGLTGSILLLLAGTLSLWLVWLFVRRVLLQPIQAATGEVESMLADREVREMQVRFPVAEWETLRTGFNRAATSLIDFQRRYRELFERASDALFILERATGRVIDANPATMALTGRPPEEMIGQQLPAELIPRGPEQRVLRWQRADGSTRTWGVTTSALTFEQGAWELASYRDLTMREQMAHSQKMEAVGALAGGIAHDFNNLMGAVLGGAAAARRLLPAGSAVHAALDGIERAGRRAADLTRQLLGFSRHEHVRVEPVNLHDVVTSVRGICSHTFDRRITIATETAADVPAVLGDAGEFEQALLNICINARDAMPHGGWLRISTRAVELDEADALALGAPKAGLYAVVAVADNGSGMTESVKARIFEPYFTTKERDKGTGLGLSLAFGVVRQAGGTISVESALGRGTTMTVYLPALGGGASAVLPPLIVRGPSDAAAPRPTPPPAPARPTVLLVDDEHALREMLTMVLDLSGYRVLEAADGTEALERVEKHLRDISVVLLDVQLPGALSGIDTFERLRASYPALPVILCSGFVRDEDLERLRKTSDEEVLLKPIDIATLLERLDIACRAAATSSH